MLPDCSVFKHVETKEYFLIITIALWRVGQGIFNTIANSTLLDLAVWLDTDYDTIATTFSSRGVGSVIGAAIFAIYMQFKPFSKVIDPMLVYGLSAIFWVGTEVCGAPDPVLPEKI